jgi:hypothetical protein
MGVNTELALTWVELPRKIQDPTFWTSYFLINHIANSHTIYIHTAHYMILPYPNKL